MDLFYIILDSADNKKLHDTGRKIVDYAAKNIYSIENPELEIINNKPKFKYSNICFSISHSKNIAAVCFDLNPVGLDIELMRNCDYKNIADRMKFRLNENTKEEFFKNWTLYEAKYKLQQPCKSLFTQVFEEKYMMAVAASVNINIQDNLKISKLFF